MNTRVATAVRAALAFATAAIPSALVHAEEAATPISVAEAAVQQVREAADDGAAGAGSEPTPEVTVTGRLRSTATDLVQERIAQEVVADFLGIEQISRVGDSSVSLALRRLPGVTLVADQFVYVRGLGERYSSTTLNGAFVPSPDLTRNVIPLDLFPAEIIESIAVHKGYTPDRPAAFGGGNVDIRTRGIPDRWMLDFQIGTGWDTESSRKHLTYNGGSDDELGTDDGTRALPGEIWQAIQDYQGDFSANNIHQALLRDGQPHTMEEAAAINRQLATRLNRNIDLKEKSSEPDLSLEVAAGSSSYFGEGQDWRFGFLALGDYQNQWRNRDRVNRSVQDPEETVNETQRTTNQVALTGSVNFGLEYGEEHSLGAALLYLRNTEDEASISLRNNFNFQRADGNRLRDYRIRYEERDLELLQLKGSHTVGEDTLALFAPLRKLPLVRDLTFSWYYSEATAATHIPNEVLVSAQDRIDPETLELQSTFIRPSSSAADFRFTDLRDEVASYGWQLAKPFSMGRAKVDISGGWDYFEKGRSYTQTQLGLGTTQSAAQDALQGTPGSVFTDETLLDPLNGFTLSVGGIGTESYLAGELIDAAFGKVELTWSDRWRLMAGVRRETFEQLSVPIDPLQFGKDAAIIPVPVDQLATFAKAEDDYYPAVAFTYMRDNFWAQNFQLRLGWSRTTARPDLREVSGATYIDPLTEARVRGNPALRSSDLENLDLRAEWFFDSGDNLTISAFYKDIIAPIETVEGAGGDDNISVTFVNAESAELYGVEIEWLKQLGFLRERLGAWTDSFFIAGNVTLSDSKLRIGEAALGLTSPERRLSQHSQYVGNLQIGFDSPGGMHSATLVYNAFGERLFFAGRNGAPDAFEQPFNSLDLIYTFYPTESLSFKLRVQNLLDENVEIEQSGVRIFEQELGMTFKLDMIVKF